MHEISQLPADGSQNRNPDGIAFWRLVCEDFRTHESCIGSQGFWALFWHRYGNWRMGVQPKILRAPFSLIYKVMAKVTEWSCGIMIPYTVLVGRRVKLEHFGGMILVAQKIGDDVILRQNTTLGIRRVDALADRPVIENGVDVGVGAVVLGSITVGAGAIIGANTVVTKDVPPNAVVGGVPACLIRMRDA